MLKKPLAYPSHLLYNTAPMEQYFRQSRPEITDRQSAAQTAKRWGMTKRRVLQLCREKKVYAAKLVDGVWTIPTVAVRPPDGRQHRGAHIPKHLANHLRYADAAVRDAREAGLGNPDDALEYFVRGSASHLHTLKYSSFNFGEVCEILSGRAVEGKPKCNRKDVEYHQLAINFIMAALKERRWLSVRFVEQLHGLLLCGDPNYREPMKGRKCVKKCVERVRSLKKHPVWLAADFFVRFLALKPYDEQLERTAGRQGILPGAFVVDSWTMGCVERSSMLPEPRCPGRPGPGGVARDVSCHRGRTPDHWRFPIGDTCDMAYAS